MKYPILKTIIPLALIVTLLTTSTSIAFALHGPNDAFTTQGRSTISLPPNAVIGSTTERRDAYNNLTEQQKIAARQAVSSIISTGPRPSKPTDRDVVLSFVNSTGTRTESVSRGSVDDSSDFFNQSGCGAFCQDPDPITDADIDLLPDSFESSLADGFTPFYYVSAGEQSGTGFATFANSLPLTVLQAFGPTPPISHYRAKPLGFYYRNDGIKYGLIQLDYLTLWNRDDGLKGGDYCVAEPILDITSLGGHALDRERAALLVAAPAVGSTYSVNPQDYNLYEAWTAAHESTFFDHSMYFNLSTPVSFNNHIELGLSRSKHGTYVFNPDMYPMVPDYVIAATYAGITALYLNGTIEYYEYLAYMFIADQNFFECIVERFQDQGGVYASTRVNVGELTHPINNAGFILDTELANKLGRLFY